MSKPLTPQEVQSEVTRQRNSVKEIYNVFNEEIVSNWNETSQKATVKQDTVVSKICERLGVTREEVFSKGWLNVESDYESSGWKVVYDKPAYNESYPSTFTFSKK